MNFSKMILIYELSDTDAKEIDDDLPEDEDEGDESTTLLEQMEEETVIYFSF
jgi:hypothetical protein